MLKQVPACILSSTPPSHPLTRPCLVVLSALLSEHKRQEKVPTWPSLLAFLGMTFTWQKNFLSLKNCRIVSSIREALLENLISSSQLILWHTKWVALIILFTGSSQCALYISISNLSSVPALCALWSGGDSNVFIKGFFQRRYSILPPPLHSNVRFPYCKTKALEQQ